jgi:hypothetical protein
MSLSSITISPIHLCLVPEAAVAIEPYAQALVGSAQVNTIFP